MANDANKRRLSNSGVLLKIAAASCSGEFLRVSFTTSRDLTLGFAASPLLTSTQPLVSEVLPSWCGSVLLGPPHKHLDHSETSSLHGKLLTQVLPVESDL
eukprot:2215924-Amphidinium_carterae.1